MSGEGTDPISRSGSASTVSNTTTSQAAASQDAVDVVSDEDDDKSGLSEEQRALLKYKNKVRKSFKSPKILKSYADQVAKVENTINTTKKTRPKEPALNTPSAVMPMPSDFEHVFHAQELQSKPSEEARKKEREEQEVLKKILQRITSTNDPVIPIYIGDDSQSTKVLNIPLARLNELNKILGKDAIGSAKKIQPMPTVKPLTKMTPLNLPLPSAFPFKTDSNALSKRSPLPKSSVAKADSRSSPVKSGQISSAIKSSAAKSLALHKPVSHSSSIKQSGSRGSPKSTVGPKSSAGPKSVVRSSTPGQGGNLFRIRTKEVKRDSE